MRLLTAMKIISSVLLTGLIVCSGVQAATINVTANTNWSAISTGSGGGGQPNNTDTINVTSGATLTLDTNGSVKDINVGDGTTNGTLTIGNNGTARTLTIAGTLNVSTTGTVNVVNSNATHTVNIAGDLVIDNSLDFARANNREARCVFNGTTQQISGAGGTANFSTITVNALSTVTLARSITIDNNDAAEGDLTISGKLVLGSNTANRAGAGATLTVNAGGELDVGGTNSLPTNFGTYTFNATSTVDFDGTNQTIDAKTYGNLTVSGSGTKTAGGNLTIAGDLAVQAGTLDIGANTANRSAAGGTFSVAAGASLLLAGTFPTNYSTVTLNATSTVNYDGTGAQTVVAQNYGNLTLSGARTLTNNVTLANAGTIGIAGTFSLTATFVTGGYVTTGSTVNFNGAAQNVPAIPGTNYNNLTLSGSGTKTGAATITVGGTLTNSNAITFSGMTTLNLNGATASTNGTGTISAGTLNVNAGGGSLANNGTVTVTDLIGAGTFTQNNGSSLNIAGAATITTLSAATNSNVVDYNGTGAQSVKAGNYFNLNISGDKGTNTVTLPAASVGVAGTFSPTATNVTYAIAGNTIDYNGAGAQNVALFAYNNLTLSNAGVKTFTAGTTSIAGALTLGGTATADATTNATLIDYNGTGAQTIVAINYNDLTISGARGANNVTLANAGTIGIAGNFNATATFGAGVYVVTGSTVNFNGAGQNVSAFGFNNLTLSGSGTKTGAATIDVGGTLTNSNGITFSGMTTLNLNGGTASTNGTGTISAGTINVNAAGGSLANSGTVTVTNLIGAGTFTQNNGSTLNIAGSATIATLSAATNSNTVDYNGTGAQSIVAANYFNLTISGDKGTNTVTLPAASVGVAGTFSPTATNVTYAIAGNTIDYNGGGAQNIALFAYNNLTLSNAGTKTFTAGTTGIAGALTITGATADATTNATTIDYNGNGAQTVTGLNYNNLTISGTRGANNVTLDNATTIGIAGVFDLSTVTFTTGSIVATGSTVNFNGAAQTVPTIPGSNYNNLTLSGSGTKSFGTVSADGILTNNNGITFTGTTLNLNGAVTSTNGTGSIQANTININNAGGTLTNSGTVTASVDLTGTGTFTQNASALLNVGGTASIATLTATAASNTVDYNANGAQTIKGTNYFNLACSTAGAKTAGGNVGIAGTLSFSGTATYDGTGFTTTFNGAGAQNIPGTGATYATLATGGSGTKTVTSNVTTTSITVNNGTTLDNGGFTINGTGTLLVTATGTLQLGGTTSFPTGYATVTLTAGSTVVFGGTAQTVDTTQTYSNVTMGGSNTKTASAALTVGNSLTVNSGVTFSGTALTLNGAGTNNGTITLTGTLDGTGSLTQGNASILSVAGDLTISTLDASTNANTVNYNGAGAQSVKATTYRTLNFSGGNTKTATAGVTVSTGLTNANGTTFSGTTLTINGASSNSGVITLSADLAGSNTLTQNANSTLNIAGNASITGLTATANPNTVNYNGAAQTIKATTYDTLQLSGTNTKTGGAVVVNTGLSVIAGVTLSATSLDLSGAAASNTNAGTITLSTNLTGTGGLTQSTGSILNIGGNATITTLDASTNANTVNYNGAGAQTVKAGITYRTLNFSGNSTKTAGAGVTVSTAMSVAATSTFSGTTLTINGASTNSGTITLSSDLAGSSSLTQNANAVLNVAGSITITTLDSSTNANTVNYNGAAQTVLAQNYRTLIFGGTNTKTASAGFTVGDSLTVNSGVTFSGTALTLNGATNNNNGTITLSGTLNGTGALTQGNASILNVAGDLTITTLDASTNANTVNYNGAGAQSVKATTYRTLNFSGGNTKTAAGTVVVSTAMTNASGTTFSGTTLQIDGASSNTGVITLSADLTGGSTLTQNAGSTLNIAGNATITGLDASTNANTVNYNGAGAQTVFVTTYRTLNFSGASTKTAGGAVTVSTAMTVAGPSTFSGTTLTINGASSNTGTITLSGNLAGSNTLTQNAGAILNVAGNVTITGLDASTNANTVNYNGGAAQTVFVTTYRTLNFSGASTKTAAGTITVSTGMTVAAASTFSGTTLTINGASTNSGIITLSANLNGSAVLTQANGSTLNIAGTLTAASIDAGTNPNTVNFNNAGAQTIPSTTYQTVLVNGSGTKTLGGNIAIVADLTVNAGTLDLGASTANRTAAGGTFTLAAGTTLLVGGANNFPANFTTNTLNATSLVNYNGAAQTVAALTYGNLTLSGSNTKTAAGAVTVATNLSITGVTYSDNGASTTVNGNIANTGTHIGAGKIVLSGGAAAHTLSGTGGYTNLELNDAQGATLSANLTINGNLTLTAGVITTGANTVVIANVVNPSVTRTAGFINGNEQKAFDQAQGANQTFTFDIASDATNYTPVSLANLNFTAGSTGTLTASTTGAVRATATGGTMPANGALNTSLARFWTVTNSTLALASGYDAKFTFVNGDLNGIPGANVLLPTFVARRLSGGNWFTTNTGTRNANDTTATNILSFSDFELGEDTSGPTIVTGSRVDNLNFLVTFSEDVFTTQTPPSGTIQPSDFSVVVNTQASGPPPVGKITTAMASIVSVTLQNPGLSPPAKPIYQFTLSYGGNTAAGTETVTVVPKLNEVFDSAGNALPIASTTPAMALVDETPPTVLSVTTGTANGLYGSTSAISIRVNFDEVVNVTSGTPQIVLNTGAGTTTVNLTAGSGTTTLSGTYTVAAGDFSTDLQYAATNSLSGNIADTVGNAGILTLPGLATAQSLAGGADIQIDAVKPTISNINPATPTVLEDSGAFTVDFNVADNIGGFANVTIVSATSNNTALIANPTFTANSGTSTRTLNFAALPTDANGSADITVTVRDNVTNPSANVSTPVTFTITVTPVNDNPVITIPTAGTLAYTEGGAAAVIDGAATATDVDATAANQPATTAQQKTPGTLTVTLTNGESFDILSIGSGGGLVSTVTSGAGTNTISGNLTFGGPVIGTFSTAFTPSAAFADASPATLTVGNTTITYQPGQLVLTVTFNGSATYAEAQAVMRNVTYNSTSERPASNTRTATFQLTDGAGGASNNASRQIAITEVNDAPAVAVTIGVAGIPGSSGSPNMAFNDQTVTGFSPVNGDNVTLTTSDQIAKVVLPTTGGTPSPVTFTATATDADDALSFTWIFTNTTTNVVSTFSGTGAFGIGNVTAFNTSTPSSTPNSLGNVFTITNTAVVEFSQAGSYTVSVQVSDGRPVGAQSANANVNTATYTHGSNGTEVELTNILNVNTPPRITPGDGVTLDTFVPSQDQPITFTVTTVTTVPPGTIDQDGHSLIYTFDYGDGNVDVFPGSSGVFTTNGNTISVTHTYTVLPPNIQPGTDGSVSIPVVVTITDGQTGAVLGTLTIHKDVTFSNPIIGAADTVDVFNPNAPSFLGIHSASQKGGGVRFTVVGCSTKGPPTAFVYGIDRTPTKVVNLVKVPADKQEIKPFNDAGLTLTQGDMYTFGFDFGKRNNGKPGVFVVEVIDADGTKARKLYAVTQQVIDGTDPATQDVNVAASFITGKMRFDKTKTDIVTFRGRFSFVSTVAKQSVPTAADVDLKKFEFDAPNASAPKPLTFVIGLGNLLVQAESNGKTGKVTGIYDYAGTKLSNGEKCSFRFKLPKSSVPEYTIRQIPNSKPVTFEAVPVTKTPKPDTDGNDYPFGTPIKDFGAVLDLKISLPDAAGSGLDTEGVSKTGGTLSTTNTKVFDPVDNGLTHAEETAKLTKTEIAQIKNIDSAREDSRVIVTAGTGSKVTFFENFRDLKVGTLKPLGVQVVLLVDNGKSQVVFASKIPTGFLVRNGFGQLAGKK